MRGFSIVEVLVVASVIGILVTVAVAGYRSAGRRVNLTATAQTVAVALDDARNRTIGSRGDSRYGVHFGATDYAIFQGSTYSAADPNNEVRSLPDGLEFGDVSLAGGGSEVVFDRLTGATSHTGTVTLRLAENPASTQSLTITGQGQADFAGNVSPTDTRLADTRHVHFTLGWTIQGTSTLTLAFSNPSHTENIPMSDYFNEDQTDFDWTGPIDVGGDEEVLRVQSHSIDATNTTLSIERDRRDNQKAVSISIDGHSIVSYAADGAATVGPDGGTMEVQ